MFYANQKEIKINRKKINSTNGKYMIAYQDDIKAAMNSLSKSAFIVYIYLLFNKDGYKFDYSPAHIAGETGISKESARNALKELEEESYIVNHGKNHYEFYEEKKTRLIMEVKRKEFIDDETGEIFRYTYEELKNAVGEENAAKMWGGD